jgi:hypothetical protein
MHSPLRGGRLSTPKASDLSRASASFYFPPIHLLASNFCCNPSALLLLFLSRGAAFNFSAYLLSTGFDRLFFPGLLLFLPGARLLPHPLSHCQPHLGMLYFVNCRFLLRLPPRDVQTERPAVGAIYGSGASKSTSFPRARPIPREPARQPLRPKLGEIQPLPPAALCDDNGPELQEGAVEVVIHEDVVVRRAPLLHL